MVNPEMPNIPGMASMTDTLEFVKKLWGGMGIPGAQGAPSAMSIPGMNIPGMVMPTLSVEEINKKIADLKTVETWLAMNMNMLRGTIQALEVQAATLSALNAMGQTVSATMATMKAASSMGERGDARGSASAPAHGAAGANGKDEAASRMQDEQDAATLAAPLVNAAAWWNMLQGQFQQAVSNAMATEPAEVPKDTGGAEPKAKAKPKSGAANNGRKSKPAKE